ncbi:MAG TPA: hypothetical protein VHB99_01100 [Pirellulales bacterium]|nr:hypothetical protein [Pirellulales bacterium]
MNLTRRNQRQRLGRIRISERLGLGARRALSSGAAAPAEPSSAAKAAAAPETAAADPLGEDGAAAGGQ